MNRYTGRIGEEHKGREAKSPKRFNLGTIALFCCLFFALLTFGAEGKEEKKFPKAPEWSLKDINGNEVKLTQLLKQGPVYMLCWDLPCVNCIAELDALVPVYDSLKERGFQLVALSVDKPSDEARVRGFVKSKKWPYIVVLDQQQKVKKAYNIIIKPTAVLINMKGEIVFTHIGYKKGDEKRIADEIGKWLPEESEEEKADSTEGQKQEDKKGGK
ncbi:MAG: TlpA family protein disulfide reductase [candidate division WOR-3 bacterium]|jgi:peroxiredoxin|nr:TlpA family protein disulfide reductase [candidate division WOR-3 bacterium]MCR4424238.1 TlpA family protein disulfide reductase [candidate division WOR-3 bacterium]MDH7519344.1 TlpA disulfide reductase family protein [bacterium]